MWTYFKFTARYFMETTFALVCGNQFYNFKNLYRVRNKITSYDKTIWEKKNILFAL